MVCGGDYYDRPVMASSGSSGYSATSDRILSQNTGLAKVLDPKQFVEDPLTTDAGNPIIFALDVSGSMQNWPKIVYDKMPMFYGQIMMQKILTDPAVSFCCIADARDAVTLQVSDYGKGVQIDQMISKMKLGGGGGPDEDNLPCESYSEAAWFFSNCMDPEPIKKSKHPFFFITGDETYRKQVLDWSIKQRLDIDLNTTEKFDRSKDAVKLFRGLKKLFKGNLFLLRKPYGNKEDRIEERWANAIGKENILVFSNPKACMDVALGAIALVAGGRSLQNYCEELKERGQDQERIAMVTKALTPLSTICKVKAQDEVQDFD